MTDDRQIGRTDVGWDVPERPDATGRSSPTSLDGMSSETAQEPEGPGSAQSPEQAVVVEPADRVDHVATHPDLRAGDRPQPPRPEVGGAGFVATSAPPVMSAVVSTGLSLWVGSLAAGLLAAGSIVRSQPALHDRFAAEVMDENPTTTLGTA